VPGAGRTPPARGFALSLTGACVADPVRDETDRLVRLTSGTDVRLERTGSVLNAVWRVSVTDDGERSKSAMKALPDYRCFEVPAALTSSKELDGDAFSVEIRSSGVATFVARPR
jgi:hypothetical protein